MLVTAPPMQEKKTQTFFKIPFPTCFRPRPSENTPKVLPNTSQDIPTKVRKWARHDRESNPVPRIRCLDANPLGYSRTSQLLSIQSNQSNPISSIQSIQSNQFNSINSIQSIQSKQIQAPFGCPQAPWAPFGSSIFTVCCACAQNQASWNSSRQQRQQREHRKWCQNPRHGPPYPHAPGAKMT